MGSFSLWHWLIVLAMLIGIGWWITYLFKRR
jgi:hypothetical protein